MKLKLKSGRLTPRQLREHNRKIAAKEIKPALTDRSVRTLSHGLLAGGQVSQETVTGIESTLRQSRRVNAKYNKAHVHTDAELNDGSAAVTKTAAPKADKGSAAAASAVRKADADTEFQADSGPPVDQNETVGAKTIERTTFGDTPGRANRDDSEGVQQSAHEGQIAFAGQHFKQTELAAALGAAAVTRRQEIYEIAAWPDFQNAHPAEAGDIQKIEAHNSKYHNGKVTFEKALESLVKKSRKEAQDKVRARLAVAERKWVSFRKDWQRAHPEESLSSDDRRQWKRTEFVYTDVVPAPEPQISVPLNSSPFPVVVYKAHGLKATQHFKTWKEAERRRREVRHGEFILSLIDEAVFTKYPCPPRTVMLSWNFGLLKQCSLVDGY